MLPALGFAALAAVATPSLASVCDAGPAAQRPSLWELAGVEPNTPDEVIRSARPAALLAAAKQGVRRLQQTAAAYTVLSDPGRRELYIRTAMHRWLADRALEGPDWRLDPAQLDAHEVLPDLWVGSTPFLTGPGLRAAGVTHVLSVGGEGLPAELDGAGVAQHWLAEGEGGRLILGQPQQFARALDFVAQGMGSGGRVCIHSTAGASRAPAVAIAYLMAHPLQAARLAAAGGAAPVGLAAAAQAVHAARAAVAVAPALLQELVVLERLGGGATVFDVETVQRGGRGERMLAAVEAAGCAGLKSALGTSTSWWEPTCEEQAELPVPVPEPEPSDGGAGWDRPMPATTAGAGLTASV
eukprot:SAG22_NODE_280_length_13084_cov_3.480209_2_plen_355_part_00